MYLFARSRAVNPGQFPDAVAAAVELASKASAIIGFPVYVWTPVLSPQPGVVTWTARVEGLDQIIAADDALLASTEFMQWMTTIDGYFTGPYTDTVSNVLHGAPTGDPPAFIQVVQGTCANGSVAEGFAMGVELAEKAGKITGHTTMFVSTVAGMFAGVGWITGFANLGELEAADAAMMANNDWLKLVDRAGHMYQPGAQTALLRRIA